jgi:hypothetical protein
MSTEFERYDLMSMNYVSLQAHISDV